MLSTTAWPLKIRCRWLERLSTTRTARLFERAPHKSVLRLYRCYLTPRRPREESVLRQPTRPNTMIHPPDNNGTTPLLLYRAAEREALERKQAEARIFAMELRRKEMTAQVMNKVRNLFWFALVFGWYVYAFSAGCCCWIPFQS